MGARRKRLSDCARYACRIAKDVNISESQNAVALGLKPLGATVVVPNLLLVAVLIAVDLDDQLRLRAKEVDDVRADDLLATELEALDAAHAEQRPEATLGLCHVAA